MNIKNLFMNLAQKVKALEYKLGLIADYVVETGTSGIWTYEKWESGKAECEATQTLTLSGTGSLWKTPIYGYTNVPQLNYPITFISPPNEVVSAKDGVGAFWVYKQAGGNNSTTQASLYALIKVDTFTSGSNASLSYIVKGKWK